MKFTPTKELLALNKAGRIRWAEALESGKYEQARNALYDVDNNRFCCIAVLLDLGGVELTNVHADMNSISPYEHPRIHMDGLNFGLDKIVIREDGSHHDAVALNDDFGLTFPQIAQLLRGNEVET